MHDFTLIINLNTADVASNRNHFHYNSTDPSMMTLGWKWGKSREYLDLGTVELYSSVIGEQEGKGNEGGRMNFPFSGWARWNDKKFLIIAGFFYPFISLPAFVEWGKGFWWSFLLLCSSALPFVRGFSFSHPWFHIWVPLQQLLAIRAPGELWLRANLFTRPVYTE